MSTFNLTLSDGLKDFVEQQAHQQKLGSAQEFVQQLIEKEQDRAQFRDKLLEGANSPPASLADKSYFDSLRARVNAG